MRFSVMAGVVALLYSSAMVRGAGAQMLPPRANPPTPTTGQTSGAVAVPFPAKPAPVRMGLWEGTTIITPATGAVSTTVSQMCVTPEAWEKALGMVNPQEPGCKVTLVKNAKGDTFDATCELAERVTMQMKGTESVDDMEHTHTASSSSMVVNDIGGKSTMTSTHRFVSASCGAVTPGKPVIVKRS
jgi:hypothetical protein